MAGTADDEDKESLTHTPTWAVGTVCVIFVVLSLLVERGIHSLGKFFLRNKQKPLYEALQKMREELTLLGFMSLLLTVARNPISKLCMPAGWATHMLPCPLLDRSNSSTVAFAAQPVHPPQGFGNVFGTRWLQSVEGFFPPTPFSQIHHAHTFDRILADGARHRCNKGYSPLFSPESIHQLHIFIFVLAVVHVFYSCLTMFLGFTQLRSWKKWEEETRVDNYDFVEGVKRSFRLQRQITFVTSRTSNPWCRSHFGGWVASFFRQFGYAVTKSDYLSLRMGFIKAHNASKKFNFHVYMMRTLEDDFRKIVGISGYLWIFVIIFMILNVHGWYAYFWISFLPILINMIVGTKLQHIITQLALETAQSHITTRVPIKPRDELFWFRRPHLLLNFIHFVLFQNAFELAFCLWLLFTFGLHSCLVDRHGFIIIRVVVGFLAQFLCSYSTLPLYALVTQMGSKYKKAIFDDPLKNAIYGWRSKAQESRKMRQKKNSGEVKNNNIEHKPSMESNSEHLDEGNLLAPDMTVQMPNTTAKTSVNNSLCSDIEVVTGSQLPLSQLHYHEARSEKNFSHGEEKVQVDYLLPSSEKVTRDNNLLLDSPLVLPSLGHMKFHTLDEERPRVEFSTIIMNPIFTM